jgi:hypothetical protein
MCHFVLTLGLYIEYEQFQHTINIRCEELRRPSLVRVVLLANRQKVGTGLSLAEPWPSGVGGD